MNINGIELINIASDYLLNNIKSPSHQEAISELKLIYDLPNYPSDKEKRELVKIVNKEQRKNKKNTRLRLNGQIYIPSNNHIVFIDDISKGGKKTCKKRRKKRKKTHKKFKVKRYKIH